MTRRKKLHKSRILQSKNLDKVKLEDDEQLKSVFFFFFTFYYIEFFLDVSVSI